MASNDDTTTVSSSVKSDNLKEIWQLLDENEKDSLLKSNEFENDFKNPFNAAFKVTGIKTPTKQTSNRVKFAKKENNSSIINSNSKQKTFMTSTSSSSAPNSARNFGEKPKIRNYNIKN